MAKKIADDGKDLKEFANKIWLAGLGAFASVGEEGGKLFESLAEKGSGVESRGKKEFAKAKVKLEEVADKAKSEAQNAWSKLETVLDDKVTASLHRVGVPSRDEIKNLSTRVAELTRKVEQMKPHAARPQATRAKAARPAAGSAKKAG
jgi:poly(hydroxyalkanoate) granule-associated protein